ncbi:prepilin-type N-terminal cleavage/methylation domain-containing protein [bacterium]|nr:prepilin-type N-terminal cleavage/methylation domain-containing protein [bacterium]
MASWTRPQTGFTLVEAMISVAVLLVLAVGSVAANRLTSSGVTINKLRSQANTLSVEAMEALLSMRAENFLGLSMGVFHPVFGESGWNLVSGQETVGSFTRSITLNPVQRNLVCFVAVCDITVQGGIDDPGSLNADVKVSWLQGGQDKEIHLTSLITYWR